MQLTPREFIIKTMARVYSSERSEPANLICENVDGDFPPISQACLFLEGRLAGWLAHDKHDDFKEVKDLSCGGGNYLASILTICWRNRFVSRRPRIAFPTGSISVCYFKNIALSKTHLFDVTHIHVETNKHISI